MLCWVSPYDRFKCYCKTLKRVIIWIRTHTHNHTPLLWLHGLSRVICWASNKSYSFSSSWISLGGYSKMSHTPEESSVITSETVGLHGKVEWSTSIKNCGFHILTCLLLCTQTSCCLQLSAYCHPQCVIGCQQKVWAHKATISRVKIHCLGNWMESILEGYCKSSAPVNTEGFVVSLISFF